MSFDNIGASEQLYMILLNLSRSIAWHCFSLIVKIIHRGWSSNVSPHCKEQHKAWETMWNILKHQFPTTGFKDNDADSLSMISWKVLVGTPCENCAISVWEACFANFFIRTTGGQKFLDFLSEIQNWKEFPKGNYISNKTTSIPIDFLTYSWEFFPVFIRFPILKIWADTLVKADWFPYLWWGSSDADDANAWGAGNAEGST